MKIRLLFTIGAVVCFILNLTEGARAQTNYFLPQPFPRSPTASAIEKYGTYQVNEFTGVPDISIPLYTIEAGGLQVPITLSYHASGVKVTDVASWVGLGWSLSSGGQISRKTLGLPDDGLFGYLYGTMLQPGTYDPLTITGLDSLEYTANGTYDSKPDIYSYDFQGHGGKFFFDGSAGNNYVPRKIPFSPIKISYTLSPSIGTPASPQPVQDIPANNRGCILRFNIEDEHGNLYNFGDNVLGDNAIEATFSSSGGKEGGNWTASAWKIHNMISQNRRDTISFSYQADMVYYPAANSEIYTVADNVANNVPNIYSASYTSSPTTPGNLLVTNEMLPQQINFKNGKVVFNLDASQRTDLPGTGSTAYGLSNIQVYKYNFGTKAMELQKTIVFYKTYFNATSTPRLRLDSIQVLDKAGSIMQHYRFDYNTNISLPDYSSFQQDYWGYYNNGNISGTPNTMLTPYQTIVYNPGGVENVTIGGANRNPDSNYMQAFVLTGIHYPTGGYTTFTYQTNQYDTSGVLALAGGLRIHTISSYDGINPTPIVKTYVYNLNKARNNYFLDNAYFVNIQQHRYYQISRGTAGEGAPIEVATETVRSFSSNPHCDLEGYDGAIVVYPNVTEYIGTPGNNIGRTDYTFTDIKDNYTDASIGGTLIYESYFFARGHLAYKKEYSNVNGSYMPVKLTANTYSAFPLTDYSQVGLVVKKQFYNDGSVGGNPIAPGTASPDDTNNWICAPYDIVSDDNYLTSTTTTTYDANDTTKVSTSTVNYTYDDITHQQIVQTTHVDSKGNTHISGSKYAYNYLNGGTTTNNAVLDSMIERNMFADPVEKWDSLQNVATSVNAITGAQLNQYEFGNRPNTIVPAKISTLSVVQPITNFAHSSVVSGNLAGDSRYVQMISFDQYDLQNNIAQYTPRNATPTSILWDYTYENPVAQIKNAVNAYNNVAYTSFEADSKGNWNYSGIPVVDPTAPTGTMVYPLSSGSITSFTLSASSTFVLSYWSNNGPATVSSYLYPNTTNLTGTALNNHNGWTYYEYQVPAGVWLTISGTTSVDDLRLYPAAAQMTTYAFDPSGLRSIADTKGSVNYFEYDYFQRLQNVKDWNGNIVKNYGYHTYDQIYASQAQSAVFTRNNCPPNTSPQSASYSVPANKYYSSTQASANADAVYDLNYNGQANANNPAVCGCPITTISYTLSNSTGLSGFTVTFSGISTPYNFPSSGSATIQVPAGTYATVTANPNGSGTHTFTMGGFTPVTNAHSATFSNVVVQTGSANLTLSVQ